MTNCPLCNLEHKTHWYYETPEFVVCDCLTCSVPMVVLHEHTMQLRPETLIDILSTLHDLFGPAFTLRCNQRVVSDHLHWHVLVEGRE